MIFFVDTSILTDGESETQIPINEGISVPPHSR